MQINFEMYNNIKGNLVECGYQPTIKETGVIWCLPEEIGADFSTKEWEKKNNLDRENR